MTSQTATVSNSPSSGAMVAILELRLRQEHRRSCGDGRGKAEKRPGIEVIAEEGRAIPRIARRDVEKDLAHGNPRADERGDNHQTIVGGPWPLPQRQHRAESQGHKAHPLQKAERTGQLSKRDLEIEGRQQHRRNGVERQRVKLCGQSDTHGGRTATR